MDPIREPRNLPPPAPVNRVGSGRPGDSGGQERASAHGDRGPAAGREQDAAPHRRGTLPPRAAEDLARAVRLLQALEAEGTAGAGSAAPAPVGPEGESELDVLRTRLAGLGLDPRGGAGLVRELAGQGAVPLRVALLAAAAELRAANLPLAVRGLSDRLLAALGPTGLPPAALAASAEEALSTALARVSSARLELSGDPAGGLGKRALDQLAGFLLRELGTVLGERGGDAGRSALSAALARADLGALAQRLAAPLLAALLALGPESPLRAALVARALESVQRRSPDPRLALLGDLAEHDAPAAERALASLVGALESEALANVQRRDSGEPTVWTLPILDHGSWSTLTLLEDRHGRDARDARGGEAGTRIAIGTEFSRLGPVRADLAVTSERVVLRLLVADPETARRVRAGAAELRERLASGGREVLVAIAEATPEEARVEMPPPRIDHLDLRG